MKNLILVESPTKAKTLSKFLGGKYDIEASVGHIRDLPKGDFGVDIEHNFEPKYVIPSDKRKIISLLKEKAGKADKIILATDPDREGEAISYHLREILKSEVKKGTKFERIAFHEITPKAISEALEHPREIDQNLVEAQTARRILDRIVGYKLSPILWKKIKRKLSAGRVQSIALRLVVEREREIEKFKKNAFCRVFVIAEKKSQEIELELVKIDENEVEQTNTINLYDGKYSYATTTVNKKLAEEVTSLLKGKTLIISDITKKETKRSPYPPFTTSSMQQEASRRLGFASRRTMSLAQRLYEEGYITYHRTDSFNLSNDFISAARDYIEKTFSKKYLSPAPRTFQTKSKLAQEAHEAVRPTNVFLQEDEVASNLGRDFAKLYSLIYKRAISTQMADANFLSVRIIADVKEDKKYTFQANGRQLLFPGFLKIWYYEDKEQLLPELELNEKLPVKDTKKTDHETTPPPRYNEASLIATLEEHGIGRPSTYAPIISTISDRYYVEKQEGRFVPTTIGTAVNDFLVKNFSEIDDIPFTAEMEDKFDDIANGQKEWVPVIAEFYKPFEKLLEGAEKQEKVVLEVEKADKPCPVDGGDLVVRIGRFGKFYACANFPKCTYKESIIEEAGYPCPKDAGKVIVKRTRTGRTFFGCSNYPNCTFAVWTKAQLLKELKLEPEQSAPAN